MKPGQFAKVNNTVVRIAKRTNGCKGCCFDNIYTCNGVLNRSRVLDCMLNEIIYKSVEEGT